MKTYGDGSELSASRPCRFTPGEKAPGIHCTVGWVGPGAGLDVVKKRKSWPCRESNTGQYVYKIMKII
jgi:hypothetical protein